MENFNNFKNAIEKFGIGYNKSIILDYISQNSFNIITQKVTQVKDALQGIVAVFEEIRATSTSTSHNTNEINQQMTQIIQSNQRLDVSLSQRVAQIMDSNQKAQEIVSYFTDIDSKTKEIKGITSKIQAVSKRTNVLAINTSIEASKAGQYGQGFKIIADEVRKLAAQTGEFAKSIEQTISSFTESVQKVGAYIQEFGEVLGSFQKDIQVMKKGFDDNKSAVDSVGNSLSLISNAVSEESLALSEGLNNLANIFDTTQNAQMIAVAIQKAYKQVDNVLNHKL